MRQGSSHQDPSITCFWRETGSSPLRVRTRPSSQTLTPETLALVERARAREHQVCESPVRGWPPEPV